MRLLRVIRIAGIYVAIYGIVGLTLILFAVPPKVESPIRAALSWPVILEEMIALTWEEHGAPLIASFILQGMILGCAWLSVVIEKMLVCHLAVPRKTGSPG